MDDEKSSASKESLGRKESHHINPDKNKNDGSISDRKSNRTDWSSSLASNTASAKSILPMPKTQRAVFKEKVNGNDKRKRRRVQGGKVEKRKRAITKRRQRIPKKKPRNNQEKKERDQSLSTIFTRLSELSATSCCLRCGHRCCGRRFEHSIDGPQHRRYAANKQRKSRKNIFKRSHRRATGAAANQVGSRAHMLSPLFIKTNSTPNEDQLQNNDYSEITPEMIHETLTKLTMWRQEIPTDAILEHIKTHYPVDPDAELLLNELEEKLRIAALVGIICRLPNGNWWLSSALENRSLTKTHVTVFWQAYVDTLKPITKPETIQQSEDVNNTRGFI